MNFTQEWWTRDQHGFMMTIVIMLYGLGALYLWFRRSVWL